MPREVQRALQLETNDDIRYKSYKSLGNSYLTNTVDPDGNAGSAADWEESFRARQPGTFPACRARRRLILLGMSGRRSFHRWVAIPCSIRACLSLAWPHWRVKAYRQQSPQRSGHHVLPGPSRVRQALYGNRLAARRNGSAARLCVQTITTACSEVGEAVP